MNIIWKKWSIFNSVIWEYFNTLSIILKKKCFNKLKTFWVAKVLMSPCINLYINLSCTTPHQNCYTTLAELALRQLVNSFSFDIPSWYFVVSSEIVNEANIASNNSYIFFILEAFFITTWINVISAPLTSCIYII